MGIEEKMSSHKKNKEILVEENELKENLNYFIRKAETFIQNYVQPELTKEGFKKWYDAVKTPFNI